MSRLRRPTTEARRATSRDHAPARGTAVAAIPRTLRLAIVAASLAGCARLQGHRRSRCTGPPRHRGFVGVALLLPLDLVHAGPVAERDVDDHTATYKRQEFDPERIVYTWAWPQDVTGGVPLTIEFSGTGDGFTAGGGEVTTSAHPGDCQDVTVPVDCSDYLPDAGAGP